MKTNFFLCRKTFNLWGILGLLVLSGLLIFQVSTHWEWSLLMDDVSYNTWMPKITDVWAAWIQEIRNYWLEGRFYPLKYLANLLKWRYLPLRPSLFHAFNFALLLTTLTTLSWTLTRAAHLKSRQAVLNLFLFLLGFGLIQRPLLDVVALNTLGESWVILFLSLGLHAYEKKRWGYHLGFVLATLCKEPAVVAFAVSAFLHFLESRYTVDRFDQKQLRLHGMIDAAILLIFLIVYHFMHQAPPDFHHVYLKHYQLLQSSTLHWFGLAFFKCSLGLLPILYLATTVWMAPAVPQKASWIIRWRFENFCLLFGIGYLWLVAANQSAPGYLLIPSSFAFFSAAAGFWIRGQGATAMYRSGVRTAFIGLFLLSAAATFYRYQRYTASINESSRLLTTAIQTSQSTLILVNGKEAADMTQLLAEQHKSPALARLVQDDELTRLSVQSFKGPIVLVELTGYFGPIPEPLLHHLEQWAGGWKEQKIYAHCHLWKS